MYDRRIVVVNFALDDTTNLTNSESFVIARPFCQTTHSRRQWTVACMLHLTNMLSLLSLHSLNQLIESLKKTTAIDRKFMMIRTRTQEGLYVSPV